MRKPKYIPFVSKTIALFLFIRAAFISMTHIGPFPQRDLIPIGSKIITALIGGSSDLFFSGHTGLPFLMALIFWKNKKLRITFLAISGILGAAVLLGHIHYSIDVFSSFFITYSIYHLAKEIFPSDYHIFHKGIVRE